MHILVFNSGSSSIKYQLIDMADESVRVAGLMERIGHAGSHLLQHAGTDILERRNDVPDHRAGFFEVFEALAAAGVSRVDAIGHRVVHGGEYFRAPALLNEATVARIREVIPLAPLHNPINLAGIDACREHFPLLPQVAAFDTAFHQGMPEVAYRYALPDTWYRDHQVRRYGFHGISHAYVSGRAIDHLGGARRLISLHLGNGCSAAAILDGVSIDTSMGMTPLEGLVMGSRCGDLDPAIPDFMARVAGLGPDAVDALLNRESGLKGLCGDNDLREIGRRAEAGDTTARLAIDLYCYRIRKYIGAYAVALGGLDALLFTAGVGENAAFIRARVCADLEWLGIRLDTERNGQPVGDIAEIQAADAPVRILVVRTNEELAIARQVKACLTR